LVAEDECCPPTFASVPTVVSVSDFLFPGFISDLPPPPEEDEFFDETFLSLPCSKLARHLTTCIALNKAGEAQNK
jgi:hypothetical protein